MPKNLLRPRTVLAVGMLVLTSLVAPAAFAAPTFTVDSTLDQPDDLTVPGTCHTAANTCTLRAAVMQANRTSGVGATIMLPSGTYTLTIPVVGSDGEQSGDLNLTPPISGNPVITITGVGAGTTIIDGNQLDRIFRVHPNRSATISGVTIRNGYLATDVGAGIYNEGSLTVSDAAIYGNQAPSGGTAIWNGALANLTVMNSTIHQNSGGGLRNEGSLAVINSSVSQNITAIDGGGIFNNGPLSITSSTIDRNLATNGGGIANYDALTVTNSTLSQNNATNNGGGIYNGGTANVYSTSIIFNGADADADGIGDAGGIFNSNNPSTVFNLRNTLVAGNNVSNSPIYDDCTGTLNSYGRNLFWSVIGCTVNTGSGSWTTLNSLATISPFLQDNGGPTLTQALLPGSNAIDGGDPVSGCLGPVALLTTDQRGAPRVVGARCDIGAFEYSPLTPPVLTSAASRRSHGAAGTFDLPLGAVTTNPTTEPRIGPAQTIILKFDKPVNGATIAISEGTATAGAPIFSGNDVLVNLTGVTNQQYVTIALTNVASTDGSTGGTGSVRVGFLAGDVNQSRVVTVADLGLVNAQLAQSVTAANFLKDVNASGTLTLADKGFTNANLTKALPPP
jgi:hypothetical protein